MTVDELEREDERTEPSTRWQRLATGSTTWIILILAAMILVFSLLEPDSFATINNWRNIATNAAHKGHGVAIFSLEMSKDSLVQRMLCAEAMIDSQAVRQGRIRDSDYPKLARASGILQQCPCNCQALTFTAR